MVALDDGSTDDTRSMLEAEPLVRLVLTNPVRPSYEGWDDLGNRQRLVDAACAIGTDWCFFLDADERLTPDDAAALRRLIDTEAQPGFAYGFEIFRMAGDERHVDPRGMWVYRLFAAADADERLRPGRLHFVPVPSSIRRARWIPTSVRLQHLGSVDEAHRQARFAKYREADPDNEFQEVYDHLLDEPPVVVPWSPRRSDVPLLLGNSGRYADQTADDARSSSGGAEIAITAVVIAQDDADVIDRSVDALLAQALDEPFEVIVVGSGRDDTVRRIERRCPSVRCFQLPARALPGEARNIGLWAARGEYVTFPGSHVWLTPGSLAARVRSHDNGWPMVTGAVVNGNTTAAGWASYFLDHGAQTPGHRASSLDGPPGHASYVTADVRNVGGFPPDVRAGEDTVVNLALDRAGTRAWFEPEASFHHASPATTLPALCRHHFGRGRALGRIVRGDRDRRAAWRLLPRSTRLPIRRLQRLHQSMAACEDTELRRRFRRVRPLVLAGAAAAAVGTWRELLATPASGAASVVPGPVAPRRPGAALLAVGGRTGEAATGLLAGGSDDQAAQRLATLARYAAVRGPVAPALAPIVTSATLSTEEHGRHVLHSSSDSVLGQLAAARAVGAGLVLQIQPGTGALDELVDHWRELLAEPDVGLLVDLRARVALAGQLGELGELAAQLPGHAGGRAHPLKAALYVRLDDGAPGALPDGVEAVTFLDLRQPGTPLPHDRVEPGPIVYQ